MVPSGCRRSSSAPAALTDDVKRAAKYGVEGVVMEIPSSHHLVEKAYRWPVQRAIDIVGRGDEPRARAGPEGHPIDATRAGLVATTCRPAGEGQPASMHVDAIGLVEDLRRAVASRRAYVRARRRQHFGVPLGARLPHGLQLGARTRWCAVAEGVDVVQTTITGIGERAGDAVEETVLALRLIARPGRAPSGKLGTRPPAWRCLLRVAS